MLVLSRKTDEQIFIGDNIKITLVRIKGNTISVGIEAPRDIRVMRGELLNRTEAKLDSNNNESEIYDRNRVFANADDTKPERETQIFVGKISSNDQTPKLERAEKIGEAKRRPAPLSQFVAAS